APSLTPLHLAIQDTQAPGKPALIFIHGFPFNQSMWREQAALCAKEFPVITYDPRGPGQRAGGDRRYMFELFVEDLLELMNQRGIGKAVLCGLSMGGYVALRVAEKTPGKVAGLVLCDTRSEADTDAGKLKRAADLKLIQEQGLSAFAEKFSKA